MDDARLLGVSVRGRSNPWALIPPRDPRPVREDRPERDPDLVPDGVPDPVRRDEVVPFPFPLLLVWPLEALEAAEHLLEGAKLLGGQLGASCCTPLSRPLVDG